MLEGVIYCYTSPSGKRYVGQTRHEVRRHAQFMDSSRGYAGFQINRARRKYGPESFKYEILERMSAGSHEELTVLLNSREQYWIEELGTFGPGGYNLNEGGGVQSWAGSHHLPETRERIGACQRGELSVHWGRHHTEEHKRYLSDLMRGRLQQPLSVWDEDGEFIGEFFHTRDFEDRFGCTGSYACRCARGGFLSVNGYVFLYSSQKDRLSERLDRISRRHPNKPRAVYKYSPDGVLVAEYPSYTEAATDNGYAGSTMCQLCQGDRYCKDFLFTTSSDEESVRSRLPRLGFGRSPHVVDVTFPDGKVQTFRSERAASEELGVPYTLVMRCCTGVQDMAMGYRFVPRRTRFNVYASSRPVLQCDATGRVIRRFVSIVDAALSLGVKRNTISASLSGHRPWVGDFFFVSGVGWDGVSAFPVPGGLEDAVLCYTKNGVFMGRYSSGAEAADALGLRRCGVYFALSGSRSHAGGYVFVYESAKSELSSRLARAQATPVRDPRPRRVEVIRLSDGVSIGVFDSGVEVRKMPGFRHAHVSAICKGKQKSHMGYTMRYVD